MELDEHPNRQNKCWHLYIPFMLWQCCAYDLVRFRHRNTYLGLCIATNTIRKCSNVLQKTFDPAAPKTCHKMSQHRIKNIYKLHINKCWYVVLNSGFWLCSCLSLLLHQCHYLNLPTRNSAHKHLMWTWYDVFVNILFWRLSCKHFHQVVETKTKAKR